jgi:hypothetical protein
LRRTPRARKTKRVQTQLRKQIQAKQQGSAPRHSVAMLSSLRNLSMHWRPGLQATTHIRPADPELAAADVDVTGKVNLRGLQPPKWCGALSGKQKRCERAYLGRDDGKVNLCSYSAEQSKCAAGRTWVSATGATRPTETPPASVKPPSPRSKSRRTGTGRSRLRSSAQAFKTPSTAPRKSKKRKKKTTKGKSSPQHVGANPGRRSPKTTQNGPMDVSWAGIS